MHKMDIGVLSLCGIHDTETKPILICSCIDNSVHLCELPSQLLEKTKRRLWFPMKMYAVAVFIFMYSLSTFSTLATWLSRMVELNTAFGYDPKDSMLTNVWESLAVLTVMQLYSYERRQSKYFKSADYDASEIGVFKRLLVWHGEKILFLALLYASLSPISAFGFLYLLGLVMCSTLPKSSRAPSKMFLLYSGFLLMVEYLFQLLGDQAEMFPGQKYSYWALLLGLRSFKPGFFGLESGLRGKVLVMIAFILQYNIFHWLDNMPDSRVSRGKWEEPCPLFGSEVETSEEVSVLTDESNSTRNAKSLNGKLKEVKRNSWPSFSSSMPQGPALGSSEAAGGSEGGGATTNSYRFFWENAKENHKWNKKRIRVLKKERLDMQKTTLKIYMKFWIENMFNLFGLEINMIALLLASFAVLNAISLLYIACLAACALLHRHNIRKLWPIFVLSFATILTLEYLSLWLNLTSSKERDPTNANVPCHDCWRISDIYFEDCKKCWLGRLTLSRNLTLPQRRYILK